MSNPNVTDIRYATALASIKLQKDSGLISLVEEDLEFLMTTKPWINVERERARRCIEAAVYGAIDYLGLPRMAVPAEFIAGTIAYFVSPVNTLTACAIMNGCEFSEHIVQGVEQPVSAQALFAHTIRVKAGIEEDIEDRLKFMKQRVTQGLI